MESLKGRLWDGKHSLLQSMKTVCVLCKNSIMKFNNPQPVQVIIRIKYLLYEFMYQKTCEFPSSHFLITIQYMYSI